MSKQIERLQKKFPQFTFREKSDIGSYYASVLPESSIEKRIANNLFIFGGVSIFISGDMYKGTPRNFIYAICYQKASVRPYRKKNFFDVEFNKVYVSGKTLREVVTKLIEQIDMSKYYLK